MKTETELQRLARLAALDGYELRQATSYAQQRAWDADLALFARGNFKFSGNVDNCRAWLHQQGKERKTR